MNRKKLALLGGVVLLGFLALRRRGRRDAVRIEIDESPMENVTDDRAGTGGVSTTDESAVALESIEGIGSAYAERLREAGVEDGADLLAADADELATETGIGERRIRGWIDRVDEPTDG